MTVKEIFEPIMMNDNVAIIDQKNHFKYWSGKGKDIPIRYCDYEVKHIYVESADYGDSWLMIAIIV